MASICANHASLLDANGVRSCQVIINEGWTSKPWRSVIAAVDVRRFRTHMPPRQVDKSKDHGDLRSGGGRLAIFTTSGRERKKANSPRGGAFPLESGLGLEIASSTGAGDYLVCPFQK